MDTLDEIASKVNVLLDAETSAVKEAAEYRATAIETDAKAENHRVAAGKLLLIARERIGAKGSNIKWLDWCKENIKRSDRDIRRLLKIAMADNPAEALEADKAKAREGMRRTRAERTNADPVSPAVSTEDVTAGMDDPAGLSPDEMMTILSRKSADRDMAAAWARLDDDQKRDWLDDHASPPPVDAIRRDANGNVLDPTDVAIKRATVMLAKIANPDFEELLRKLGTVLTALDPNQNMTREVRIACFERLVEIWNELANLPKMTDPVGAILADLERQLTPQASTERMKGIADDLPLGTPQRKVNGEKPAIPL
jgi:hypothetical protein